MVQLSVAQKWSQGTEHQEWVANGCLGRQNKVGVQEQLYVVHL